MHKIYALRIRKGTTVKNGNMQNKLMEAKI